MTFNKQAQKVTAVVSGIIFLIILLVLAILFPTPKPFPYTVFRIVMAIATAAFAATIPGFLEVKISGVVRATGAIAVFAIVYFFSPASMVTDRSTEPIFLGPKNLTPFEASIQMPGVQGTFIGEVVGGKEVLTVNLKSVMLSYPKPAPDGGNRYITYYRILLAKAKNDSWFPISQSDKQQVEQILRIGHSISLDAANFTIPLVGVSSLAGHWLVFEVGVALSQTEASTGTTYAHTEPSLL